MVKDCYSHRFASWLDLRRLFASFRFVFAVDFAILELHKGFIWVGLADNIVLKVCGSHHILDFVIRCHRFASYLSCWSTWWAILDFVLLELYKGN